MGFFSKTCAKTHMPITANCKKYPRFYNVVALTPDGKVYYGEYDGYGNVGGVSLSSEWDSVKLVLFSDYKGETYEQLGKSHNELAQGFFMDDAFLRYALNKWTFKTIGEYKRAFIKYANW